MTFLASLLFIPTLLFAAPLPFYENKDMTPYWEDSEGVTNFKPAKVSEFTALDQSGEVFSLDQMKSHLNLVNFFFVQCPGVCPAMMRSVQKIQKALAREIDEVQILSFSVMPEADTPDRLQKYAKTYGIDSPHWKLLTGSKKSIYKVGKEMFKADGAVGAQKNDNSFIHTQNIYLVDKDQYIRGIYNTADENEMKNLAEDLRKLR